MPNFVHRRVLLALALVSCIAVSSTQAGIPDSSWLFLERLHVGTAAPDSDAQVEIDSTGGTVAVWINRSLVLAKERAPGAAWTADKALNPGATLIARNLHTAMDAAGNVIATWEVDEANGTFSVWAARYLSRLGWQRQIQIASSGKSRNSVLTMNAAGSALLVWQNENPSNNPNTIWSKHYDVSTNNWGPLTEVEKTTPDAINPTVAMNANGNGIAIWQQLDGNNRYTLTWSQYRQSDNSWSAPATTVGTNVGTTAFPRLAMSPNGDATAIWFETTGFTRVLMANRYSAATGKWSTVPTTLGTNEIGNNAQVAMNSRGNAVAMWSNNTGKLQAAEYILGSVNSWSAPLIIAVDTRVFFVGAGLGIDASGNSVVAWARGIDSTHDRAVASRHIAGAAAWTTPEIIGRTFSTDGLMLPPRVTVNAALGTVAVVWTQEQIGFGSLVWLNRLQ